MKASANWLNDGLRTVPALRAISFAMLATARCSAGPVAGWSVSRVSAVPLAANVFGSGAKSDPVARRPRNLPSFGMTDSGTMTFTVRRNSP